MSEINKHTQSKHGSFSLKDSLKENFLNEQQNKKNLTQNSEKHVAAKHETAHETKTESPVLDKLGRAYATGKRKTSIARIWLKKGTGIINVNGKDIRKYFSSTMHITNAISPFTLINAMGQFDVFCTVKGGGIGGQSGAILHGIAKALVNFQPSSKYALKQQGFLTRDSRKVERKKYGQHKARKSTQFSKR